MTGRGDEQPHLTGLGLGKLRAIQRILGGISGPILDNKAFWFDAHFQHPGRRDSGFARFRPQGVGCPAREQQLGFRMTASQPQSVRRRRSMPADGALG